MGSIINVQIVVYFVYGLAFYTMGIGALIQASSRYKSNRLIVAIPYLGLFGLLHGSLEWFIMLSFTSQIDLMFYRFITNFLSTTSFFFLLIFALKLIWGKHKKAWQDLSLGGLIMLIFIVYLVIVWQGTGMLTIKTILGVPSAVLAGYGFIVVAKDNLSIQFRGIRNRLFYMGGLFSIYGVTQLVGLKELNWFKDPGIELIRTVLAVLITFSFISVIRRMKFENEKHLSHLIAQQGINNEYKRIARELHDIVLQDLFSAGLQLEMLEEHMESKSVGALLINELKSKMNNVMLSIRNFISTSTFDKNDISDLIQRLQSMIISLQEIYLAQIVLEHPEKDNDYGFLNLEEINHIYYIVREAVINGLKHSKGSETIVTIHSTIDGLFIAIKDNGIGFDVMTIEPSIGKGLSAIKERTQILAGELTINSNSKGTEVDLYLPWEK